MSRTETGSRERIVDATLVLLRRGGLAASGVNSVVAEGKAPKGSVYHYFPGGKTDIVIAALQRNRDITAASLQAHLGSSHPLARRIKAVFKDLAARMSRDGFTSSCAIGAVALDIGADETALRDACAAVMTQWIELVAECLPEFPANKRRAAAEFFISLVEGAQLAARARKTASPIANAEEAFLLYAKAVLG
jgi:TetR/AcrR family transcriptional repressor of lmrAB and yxaGH operons